MIACVFREAMQNTQVSPYPPLGRFPSPKKDGPIGNGMNRLLIGPSFRPRTTVAYSLGFDFNPTVFTAITR